MDPRDKNQNEYTIQGYKVAFPCKAYPSQLAIMNKILEGLKRKQNCLIESPTGSGKSLALLCSCLAWQAKQKELQHQQMVEELQSHENPISVAPSSIPVPVTKEINGNTAKSPVVIKEFLSEQSKEDKLKENKSKSMESPSLLKNKASSSSKESNTDSPASRKSDSVKKRRRETPLIFDLDDDDDFKPSKKQQHAQKQQVAQNDVGGVSSKYFASKEMADSGDVSTSVPGTNQPENTAKEESPQSCCNCQETKKETIRIPKIFFGTRTHKQITQIVREFKKTVYRTTRMCVLSSRERTCIHPQISKSSNKNEECKELLDSQFSCRYYTKLQSRPITYPTTIQCGVIEPWDIEEIVHLGKQIKVCSYFWARDLMNSSDIIFCPYNYLIDPMIRSSLDISLSGSIVVLDEAHNIEDAGREAASFSVTLKELRDAIQDLEETGPIDRRGSKYAKVARVLSRLSVWIARNSDHLSDYRGFEMSGKVWSGTEIVAVLSDVGAGPENYSELRKHVEDISVEAKDQDELRPKLLSFTLHLLEGLLYVMDYLYRNNLRYMEDFSAAIVKTAVKKTRESSGRWLNKQTAAEDLWTHTLNFWCLNPAVAMSDIKDKIHSLIVASGTLSPMDSFQSELGLPFQIQLEANHVISKSQVWVGTIARGPKGGELNASFKNSETFVFQDEVGQLVLNICKVVPHGVLCFFPSYGMMNKLTQRWQTTGLWEEMEGHKVIVMEPQNAATFELTMAEFYEQVEQDNSEECCGSQSITGALFLAVCRGKVSEGLDFADNNARAVITVGIPFPSIKDIQVDLKRKYNDKNRKQRAVMTGSHWYETQGFRALNQALGRCIRHKEDWGALIIVDARFYDNGRYVKALSKWLRNQVYQYCNCDDALKSLQQFITLMTKDKDQEVEPSTICTAEDFVTSTLPPSCIDVTDSPEETNDSNSLTDQERNSLNLSMCKESLHEVKDNNVSLEKGNVDTTLRLNDFSCDNLGTTTDSRLTAESCSHVVSAIFDENELATCAVNQSLESESSYCRMLSTVILKDSGESERPDFNSNPSREVIQELTDINFDDDSWDTNSPVCNTDSVSLGSKVVTTISSEVTQLDESPVHSSRTVDLSDSEWSEGKETCDDLKPVISSELTDIEFEDDESWERSVVAQSNAVTELSEVFSGDVNNCEDLNFDASSPELF